MNDCEIKKSAVDRMFENKVGQAVAIVLATVGVLSFFSAPIQNNQVKINEVEAKVNLNEKINEQNNNVQTLQLAEIKVLISNLDTKLNSTCEKLSALEAILKAKDFYLTTNKPRGD